MPRPPHDEETKSNTGGMPVVPRRLVSGSRKGLLMLVMFALGIPVFFVMLAPPLAGGWILWQQYALYRDDGRWREFSLFELATLTLDENLAANLHWPGLAVCNGLLEAAPPGPNGAGALERAAEECPQPSPAQSWLLHPPSSPEWPKRVAGGFRAVPVSSLLFFFGLVLSFLLRLYGANWKLRSPSPFAPESSPAAPRKLASGPEPKE